MSSARTKKPKRKHRQKISRRAGKEKGKSLQRWACKQVSQLTGFKWGPPGTDLPIEPRAMGQSGADVRLEPAVQALFPYAVECKAQETWSVPAWIRQTKANCREDLHWLLIAKRNHHPPVVIVDAEHFFTLLQKRNEVE